MKRFFLLIISAIMACMAFVGCNKGEGPTTGYIPKKYDIEYKTVDETGVEISIDPLMWTPNGNYPTQYTEKTAVEIGSLRNIRIDEDTICVFEGWYYDLQYKQLVENNTITKKSSNITLYAKISEKEQAQGTIATITYKWNDFGYVKEGVGTMPAAMIVGLEFPTEYEEGLGEGLPILKTWKQSKKVTYEFEGWYYDAEFEHKVDGNVISTEKTGNLVLYAAIAIWVG